MPGGITWDTMHGIGNCKSQAEDRKIYIEMHGRVGASPNSFIRKYSKGALYITNFPLF
jgi:hypothetical protein